jgi:TetR/AcrR family tetracycline transcriptional repressor
VNDASLFHHYKDKAEILDDVLRLALSDLIVMEHPPADWREYLIEQGRNYYRAVLAHPNIVPLLYQHLPRRFGHATENQAAEVLLKAGFPPRYVLAVREQLEFLILGVAQFSFGAPLFADVPNEYGALHRAITQSAFLDPEERLDIAVTAFVRGIDQLLSEWQQRKDATSPRARRDLGRANQTGRLDERARAQG